MIIILLILSVLTGVLAGKYFGSNQQIAKILLVISAGFLITITANEVLPAVFEGGNPDIGLWIIGGVLLQMFLESLTKGFEHGHLHHHKEKSILPLALMVGMFLHAFLEGLPLADHNEVNSPYLMGILVHNLPISFVLGAFLLRNKKSSISAWFIILIFALASPLGVILGDFFSTTYQPYFLAVVAGIFLHISSVIIFESNKNHQMDWQKILYVLIGVGLAMFGHLFHDH